MELHQLVSERLDPVLESSKEGSSGHGRYGGLTSEGRRALHGEDQFLSIEDTIRALSGTVLDLNVRLDKIEGKFERMMEELIRSNRNPVVLNQNSISKPTPHYTMAAQSPFSTAQMSNFPIPANFSNTWGMNSPVPHSVVSANEQTPVGTLISHQNPSFPAMGSMTSGQEFMLMGLHMEPETRIMILTTAAQKYKVRRGSKLIEEQSQLYANSSYSSSLPRYHTASYVFDEMHEREPQTVDEALIIVTAVEPTDVVVIENITSECLPVENEVTEKTNVEIDVLALKRMVKSAVTGPQVVALMEPLPFPSHTILIPVLRTVRNIVTGDVYVSATYVGASFHVWIWDPGSTIHRRGCHCIMDSGEELQYYVRGGLTAALAVLKWLGIDTEQSEMVGKAMTTSVSFWICIPRSDDMEILEKKLYYEFSTKGLLLEAITHAFAQEIGTSYFYQRLEFLGDTILVLLITLASLSNSYNYRSWGVD